MAFGKLSRRGFVKAGAGASLVSGGVAARAFCAPPALVVYDSRLPGSRAFAAGHTAPLLDIAGEHERRLQGLRQPLPAGRLVGLTRWSDYVLVRGIAGDQRRRISSERVAGALIAWEIS